MPNIHAVLSEPGDLNSLAKAFAIAVQQANSGNKHVTILAPIINKVRNSDLGKLMGDKFVRDLVNKKLKDDKPISFYLVSDVTIVPRKEKGVVLGLWCSPSMLDKIDECKMAIDIVAISHTSKEMRPWAIRNNAQLY
jgi:hypothetical protein